MVTLGTTNDEVGGQVPRVLFIFILLFKNLVLILEIRMFSGGTQMVSRVGVLARKSRAWVRLPGMSEP